MIENKRKKTFELILMKVQTWAPQFKLSKYCTVWKFHDFSVIQILREINFGESRSFKTVVFDILGALNLADLVNFSV